ncbi:MAG: hypothetical protein IT249_05100 [Chitinophagaceae bacterium]|nr:hypothetical protein [Chitinophagaceae bacterium]
MSTHILGIRHHGPGSARNVKNFLEEIKPDIVLVEGPPEADEILQWAVHNELKPPVAILCYQPDDPKQACFYPFAEFSPEWQAILYAKQHNIHVRFMDLPIANQFALEKENKKQVDENADSDSVEPKKSTDTNEAHTDVITDKEENIVQSIKRNPIAYLADAAGYDDAEKWWEHMFEYRNNNEQVFDAVAEAMQTLRSHLPQEDNKMEVLREAHMRKTIRQAEKEMFQNIAVICGAWHAPVLKEMPKQKEDNDLLKGLPKEKVACTWVPWTYGRLGSWSGYGAGIHSPGWYEHTWQYANDDGTRWMAKVAALFRKNKMDTSVAHVIESVRLADSLAALRNLSKAGLEELNEATLSVLCNGENILLNLVHDELMVSNKIGEVPTDIPKPPLQVDIEKLQKRLRLPATADFKDYTLDLRKEGDLERSVFLHRLKLLNIGWGANTNVSGKGTFKEQWRLQWDPNFSIEIIEKGAWGNTVEEAAAQFVIHYAKENNSLQEVCILLQQSIPAELSRAIDSLISQVNNLAAASADTIQLMEVIPDLVSVSRYGNVRKTDAALVTGIIDSMITRICVSLPAACVGIDEDAAQHLVNLLFKMNDSVSVLQQDDISKLWQETLLVIAKNNNAAPAVAGYATRLLSDGKILTGDDLVQAFYYSMSVANAPGMAAAWLEGFLKGSGTLLLLDEGLWNVVNNWVAYLREEEFIQVLPLLRRTFARYSNSERKKLGEKVVSGKSSSAGIVVSSTLAVERAKQGIPVMMQLFGYGANNK